MGDGIVLIQIDLYDVLNSVFLTFTDSFGTEMIDAIFAVKVSAFV